MYEPDLCINMSGQTISVYRDPLADPGVKIGTLSPREAFSALAGEGFNTVFFRNSSGVVTEGYIPDYTRAPDSLYTLATTYPYGTVRIDGELFYTFKFRRAEEVYTAAGNRWGTVASGMRVACRTDMMGENHHDWKGINYVERSTDGAWVKVTGDGYNYGFVDTGLAIGSMPNTISMYGTW